MDRNSVDWKGYWPACPTPFKTNGEIDFESFDKLLDWYLDRKMQGLFINGTTGEWFAQSHQERKVLCTISTSDWHNNQPHNKDLIEKTIRQGRKSSILTGYQQLVV